MEMFRYIAPNGIVNVEIREAHHPDESTVVDHITKVDQIANVEESLERKETVTTSITFGGHQSAAESTTDSGNQAG